MATPDGEERDVFPLRMLGGAAAGLIICAALGVVIVGLAMGIATAQALLVGEAHSLPTALLLIFGLLLFMAVPVVAVRQGLRLRRLQRALRTERLGDSVALVLIVGLVAIALGLLLVVGPCHRSDRILATLF